MITHHRRQTCVPATIPSPGRFVQQNNVTRVFPADASLFPNFPARSGRHFRPGKRNVERQPVPHIASSASPPRRRAVAPRLPLAQPFARDDIHDLIAIDFVPSWSAMMAGRRRRRKRDAEVRLLRQHARACNARTSVAPRFFVNVDAVWLTADGDNSRASSRSAVQCDMVGSAVSGAITTFRTVEAPVRSGRCLYELNIASGGVDDAARFPQLGGSTQVISFPFRLMKAASTSSGSFIAVDREEFNAVHHRDGLCEAEITIPRLRAESPASDRRRLALA